MNTGVVSMRYAKALLAYASSSGKEERVYDEVKKLVVHFSEISDLRHAIENPILGKTEKLALLVEAAGGKNTSEELRRFFQLVLEARREKFLQFMMWSYIDLYRKDKHILVGKLSTAVESDRLAAHLSQLVSERTHGIVELVTKVDGNLLGGFIIELGGYRMDASVASQLKRVRHQFMARNKRIV